MSRRGEDILPESDSFSRIIECITKRIGESLTLKDLAIAGGLPESALIKKFNQDLGISPMRWLWQIRIYLSAELIAAEPEWSLTKIAITCGFSSLAHFSRRFRGVFHKTPSAFRAEIRCIPKVRKRKRDEFPSLSSSLSMGKNSPIPAFSKLKGLASNLRNTRPLKTK